LKIYKIKWFYIEKVFIYEERSQLFEKTAINGFIERMLLP